MKIAFLLLLFILSPTVQAAFLGEYCEPEDETFLLKSPAKINKQSINLDSEFSFVRSASNGDETDVVLKEGQDFHLKIAKMANVSKYEEKLKCGDGHESTLSSGAADFGLIFSFKEESLLSKSIQRKIKDGKFKVKVSCQWSAEEDLCVESN